MIEREVLTQSVMVNGEVVAADGLRHWEIIVSQASLPPLQDGTPGCLSLGESFVWGDPLQMRCGPDGKPPDIGIFGGGGNNQPDNSPQPKIPQPQPDNSNDAPSGISDVRELRTEVGATVGKSIDSSLTMVYQMTGFGACIMGWLAIEALSLGLSRFRISPTVSAFKGIYKAIRWLV